MVDHLHTVWISGELLGILCKQCDHRAVLGPDPAASHHRANMTRLRDLKILPSAPSQIPTRRATAPASRIERGKP